MATFGTFVDGVSLKASEMNGLFASVVSAPVIRQPGIISTSGVLAPRGSYYIVNKTVFYTFLWVNGTSGGGTANNRIELDLPVAAASNSMRVIGDGLYLDSSANLQFRVAIVQYSTTRAAFLSETTTSLTTYLGQTNGPGLTLAVDDRITGLIVYEAA